MHEWAFCVKNRVEAPSGGTAFSPSYSWNKNFDIDTNATQCACTMYRNRNTGGEWWDTCPDCVYDEVCTLTSPLFGFLCLRLSF